MIRICGNCDWYAFKDNPASDGVCINKKVSNYHRCREFSPLTKSCTEFKSKRR